LDRLERPSYTANGRRIGQAGKPVLQHACMTGRGTQKLIGPIDRKFEALTIEVD